MIRSSEINRFTCYTYNLLTSRTSSKGYQNVCSLKSEIKCFSTVLDANTETEENKKRKKTVRVPNIKLIHPDKSMTISLLEEAQKIAKRQNLHLVKQTYTDRDNRDVYELCDSTEFFENRSKEDTTEKVVYKNTKFFPIQSKIKEHDLAIKLNNINKLLQKNHKIKIAIMFPTEYTEKEEVIKTVKKRVQGELKEERKKGSSFMLIYLPLLNKSNNDSDKNIVDVVQR
ncbi:uncharacterized protein LOC143215781 [Lasioglossum baleicum]|uniref:uncharacterized protein LOC143215781 n=1 Tax=Lasioglossum baleicum TaxID=434251 RepID=UPI003FCD342F